MTEQALQVLQVGERAARGPVWIPLAAAAVAASLLGVTVDGSQATALPDAAPPPAGDDTALQTAASSAAAGTLLLVLRDDGGGFSQDVTDLAPGDSAVRYVDVVETGTLDGRRLTLRTVATGPLVPGLAVSVEGCRGGSWEPTAGTCSGNVDRLLTSVPLSGLDQPRLLDPLGPARRLPLRVTLTLADRQENAVNGVLPAGSLQGATARLQWSFSVVQA